MNFHSYQRYYLSYRELSSHVVLLLASFPFIFYELFLRFCYRRMIIFIKAIISMARTTRTKLHTSLMRLANIQYKFYNLHDILTQKKKKKKNSLALCIFVSNKKEHIYESSTIVNLCFRYIFPFCSKKFKIINSKTFNNYLRVFLTL